MEYRYNHDDWKKLSNANCVDVAKILGLEIDEKSSTSKSLKIRERGGLFIWRDGSGWYCHSTGEKGIAVQLVEKELYCTYGKALDYINENVYTGAFTAETSEKPKTEKIQKSNIELPKKEQQPKRVYAYLIKTRCIDKTIVAKLIAEKKIFQEKETGNCCFVGTDEDGKIRYCTKRGTGSAQFRGEVSGSEKNYGFKIEGNSNILKVFESPIDAMSHATLALISDKDWHKDTRLSLGGVTLNALRTELLNNPNKYNEIWCCLDNDVAGLKAASDIVSEFGDKYKVIVKKPVTKDFNNDLQIVKTIARDDNVEEKVAIRELLNGLPHTQTNDNDIEIEAS